MYDMKALYEAESVAHAIALLQEHPQAQIIAGGSDVLVQMREGKRAGAELVSLFGLDELRGVKLEEDGTIRIGSLTSFSHITKDPAYTKIYQCTGGGRRQGRRPSDPQYRYHRRQYLQRSDLSRLRVHAFCMGCHHRADRPGRDPELPIREFYIKAGKVDLSPAEIQTGILIPRRVVRGILRTLHQIRHAECHGHCDPRLFG